MAETDKPDLGLAAWADLAAVRRTIEWVGIDPQRLERSLYTGKTVGRLLRRIQSRRNVDDAIAKDLARLIAMMDDFDQEDVAGKAEIISDARGILDAFVPLGELGARRHDLEPKATLSKPSRRDRRNRRDAAEVAESKDTEASADTAATDTTAEAASTEDSPDTEADSDDVAETPSEAGGEPEPVEEPEPFAWLNLPQKSPRPPNIRPPRRLEWNHPEGTGKPISELGVLDDQAVAVLAEMGMNTIGEFLSRPPETHALIKPAQFVEPGGEDGVDVAESVTEADPEPVMVRGRVVGRFSRLSANGTRHEIWLEVRHAGRVRCAWVGEAPRGWWNWRSNMELAFIGALEAGDDGWCLFEAEPVGVDGRGSGWAPQYGIDGVDDQQLRSLAATALLQVMGRLREPLPRKLVEYHKLVGLDDALRDAHFPANKAGKGRNRLAFQELLLLQAGIGWRAKSRNRERGMGHKVLHSAVGELSVQQHLNLTDSQEVVFSEIRRDLKSNHAMVRLLQGEVGTHKTNIALLTASVVMQNKAQVLYVLPESGAAERRFLFSEGIFRSVGFSPAFIPGAPTRGQADAIARGEYQVVFGTKALLDNAPKWHKLGLVIVEERNEYGTVDPSAIVDSGPSPDLLVITDTPIPSSLTLTVFGEYRMSMLKNDHSVRCTTSVYEQAERKDAYAAVHEAVEEGRQAYVVFPVGDDGDLLGPEDALRYAGALQSEALEGARIGVYCSAMSREDRLRVFEDFQHRRIDVLVATTHIEEAPLVSNATVMVVEHADHHELVRLHRLRGHVGQGIDVGQCLMVMSEKPNADAQQRLTRLGGERDGFKIAEMDLKERGWDALLGDGAEEAPVFHWADPVLDHQKLLMARDEAFRLVKQDPGMRRHREMVDAVVSRWGSWLGDDFAASRADFQGGAGRGKDKQKGRRRRRRRR